MKFPPLKLSNSVLISFCLCASALQYNVPASEMNALWSLFNATDGANWVWNNPLQPQYFEGTVWNFTPSANPCTDQWQGVTCGEPTTYNQKHVAQLSLVLHRLHGYIPAEIGQLTQLRRLELASNPLSGSIPVEIGQLTHLQELYLDSNELSGSIPAEIGQLTQLQELHSNELFGRIPVEIGQLIQLQELHLDSNKLFGSIPEEIGELTQLLQLYLDFNELSGSIPAEVGQLTRLQELYLEYNKLSGSIPVEIGQLTQLQELDLDTNALSGSIPAEIGQLTQLQLLYLFVNTLSGSIPAEIWQLTLLQSLALDTNALAGSIPATIGLLTQLQLLYLDFNELSGSIPAAIGQLMQLQVLYLATNELSGSIPAEVGQLTQLQELYLSFNALSGSIPAEIGQLAQLLGLYLQSNQLSGNIPAEIGQLTQLLGLYLYSNELSSSIPVEVGQLTQLQELYLYSNELSSSIPAEVGQLAQLQELYLYSNKLSGSIPAEIGQLTQLRRLNLTLNQLSGSIPAEIGQLSILQYLDFDSNELSGSVPVEIGQLTRLQVLDLGSNELSGAIPVEAMQLVRLSFLDLGANKLSHTIPSEIEQLMHLNELSLGQNHLSGSIPAEIGQLTQLQYFDMNNNELLGSLPAEIGQLVRLQVLNLGTNALSGSIPAEIGQLTQLQYCDVDTNLLSGSIAGKVGELTRLQELKLSANMLTGSIPTEMAQLTQLQVMDLDTNQLSGTIPVFLGQLTRLEYINVANNALTGTIPGELFQIANLSALIAGKNCLEGVLPRTLCDAAVLGSINLDGLHTAPRCSKRQVAFTYVYGGAKDFHGTIPDCIFSLPLLTSLHLSGNSLTGTIPGNLSADAVLTDLVLSHNSLVGSIPTSIQQRAWNTLDLSYNRLDGTLLTSFGEGGSAIGNASASVYLKNNRLSGRIPGYFVHLTDVKILGSNMFSCGADRSDLPAHDVDKDRYQCGSNAFIGHVAAASAILMVTSVLVIMFSRCQGRNSAMATAVDFAGKWLPEARFGLQTLPPGVHFFGMVCARICDIAVWCALAIVLCLIPWYAAAHSQYSTYTHAYAWVVSAAFLSGLVPAVTELALYSALMMAVAVGGELLQVWKMGNSGQRGLSDAVHSPRSASSATSLTMALWYQRLLHALFFLTNLTVVLLVNVGFVAASLQANQAVLALAQILFTAFKLYWNMVCTPYMIDLVTAHSRRRVSSSLVAIHMFLSILNNIVIPCLVVAVQSPSCFLNVFQASSPVNADYDVPGCITYTTANSNGSTFGTECSSQYPDLLSLQFEARFSYSYQCSSSFITYYSPVFVLMGLTAGVLIPVAQALSLYCLTRATPGTLWHRVLNAAVPRILKPATINAPPLPDDSALVSTPASILRSLRKERVFNGVIAVSAIITYLGILLTFGVVFPPLAVVMCATMWSAHWQTKLILGKFVHDAQAAGAVHLIERLEQDCRSVVSLQTLQRVMFLITCICCCFYALFLFDTLGDARGAADSYWIFLVMALFPVVLYVLSRALQTLQGKLGTAERSGSYVDDNMFEMATLSPGPPRQLEEGSSQEAAAAVSVRQERDRSAVSQAAGMSEAESAAGVTMNAMHSNA